jgi:protein-disulfide isomerase
MQALKYVRNSIAVAVLALGLTSSLPAMATHQSRAVGNFDAEDSRNIEELVREYILNHPEVILESVEKLRAQQQQAAEEQRRAAAGAVKATDDEDHIVGNPDAPVKLVEFSDFECPFCKRVHPTLKKIMADYGSDGDVAWVYRHFPLDSIHPKARKEAQAAECANELGGNDAFWAFSDRLYEVTPSNNRLKLSRLPQIAEEIGLDRSAFEDCLAGDARGGKYADHIEADNQDAIASGGRGTPYIVVIAPNGKTFPISGAQPYAAIKAIIELALNER